MAESGRSRAARLLPNDEARSRQIAVRGRSIQSCKAHLEAQTCLRLWLRRRRRRKGRRRESSSPAAAEALHRCRNLRRCTTDWPPPTELAPGLDATVYSVLEKVEEPLRAFTSDAICSSEKLDKRALPFPLPKPRPLPLPESLPLPLPLPEPPPAATSGSLR